MASDSTRPPQPPQDHALLDARNLKLSQAVAARLRAEPSHLPRALTALEAQLAAGPSPASGSLEQWRTLLQRAIAGDPTLLFDALELRNEAASRLRSASPFVGVLSQAERRALLADVDAHAQSGDPLGVLFTAVRQRLAASITLPPDIARRLSPDTPDDAFLDAADELVARSDSDQAHGAADLPAMPESDEWAAALLRGRSAVAAALEAAGGVWSAEEVVHHCAVCVETLLHWRQDHRVLAIERANGVFEYPVAQFPPRTRDATVIEPYASMHTILVRAGEAMGPEELAALMATPQTLLADADGHDLSPFAALATGRAQEVVGLVEWVLTPSDVGAPAVE